MTATPRHKDFITVRPWMTKNDLEGVLVYGDGPEGRYIGHIRRLDDAALIVHAVNRAEVFEAMVKALERIARHGVIMGSKDDYRQGQLDVLESVHTIAKAALALCEQAGKETP